MRTRILLQTTIPAVENDWHIGRFGMLAAEVGAMEGVEVTARDRAPVGADDPVLSSLSTEHFDQAWIFGVDAGGDQGLSAAEVEGLRRFHDQGGALMLTRDHHDMGCGLSPLGEVGAAHCWQTVAPEADAARHQTDDDNPTIGWPNYHSGRNGAFQAFEALVADHPLLDGVRFLPAHPHEGALRVPEGGTAVARGRSLRTDNDFLLVVSFDRLAGAGRGRAVAHSSFHHFADYNLDPDLGCPSFVTDPVAPTEERIEEGIVHSRRYWRNLAAWLAGPDGRTA